MSNKLQDLPEMIEKILFDEKELEILKTLINELTIGSIEPKELRKSIIENRVNILNKVLNIFPFYYKQVSYQQEINDFTEKDLSLKTKNEFKNELEEKDEILRQIGEWIQNTRKKLEKEINI
ncbi:MAG: hypothetical protein ACFFG0_12890 [Candidatus Thorarchaeota archaeon]